MTELEFYQLMDNLNANRTRMIPLRRKIPESMKGTRNLKKMRSLMTSLTTRTAKSNGIYYQNAIGGIYTEI